jgi:hypothetical protein
MFSTSTPQTLSECAYRSTYYDAYCSTYNHAHCYNNSADCVAPTVFHQMCSADCSAYGHARCSAYGYAHCSAYGYAYCYACYHLQPVGGEHVVPQQRAAPAVSERLVDAVRALAVAQGVLGHTH